MNSSITQTTLPSTNSVGFQQLIDAFLPAEVERLGGLTQRTWPTSRRILKSLTMKLPYCGSCPVAEDKRIRWSWVTRRR